MLKFACKPQELSCIIGHLFVELEPPCEECGGERVTIKGTAYNGDKVEIFITEWGFEFNGNAELIEKIREGVCLYERSAEPSAAAGATASGRT